MATGIVKQYNQTEITICANCYHKDVCGNKDYLTENACCNYKEAGLVVELPCKVGDTVYLKKHTYTKCTKHNEQFNDYSCQGCEEIGCDSRKVLEIYPKVCTINDILTWMQNNHIGKTVFLTKEAAEANPKSIIQCQNFECAQRRAMEDDEICEFIGSCEKYEAAEAAKEEK